MESSTDARLVFALLSLLLAPPVAQAQQEMPLYTGEIPNSIAAPDEEATRDPNEQYLFRLNVSRPTLTVYEPRSRDTKRAAVIILPGGSYRGVSIVKEGHDVARAFNDIGTTAFVLKYRTPSERHMLDKTRGPLQDAQQAIHVVRDRADEWRIDRSRNGRDAVRPARAAGMALREFAPGLSDPDLSRHQFRRRACAPDLAGAVAWLRARTGSHQAL